MLCSLNLLRRLLEHLHLLDRLAGCAVEGRSAVSLHSHLLSVRMQALLFIIHFTLSCSNKIQRSILLWGFQNTLCAEEKQAGEKRNERRIHLEGSEGFWIALQCLISLNCWCSGAAGRLLCTVSTTLHCDATVSLSPVFHFPCLFLFLPQSLFPRTAPCF